MKDRMWDSVGALSGIIFAALLFVGVGMSMGGESHEPSDSSAQIARTFVERSERVQDGAMIHLVGLVFFFGFLAYLRRRLQQAEGAGGWLASSAYGGGLVTAAMLLLLVSMELATTAVPGDEDTQVAKVFVVYLWNFIWVLAPPMIALVLGASLVIVRYAALPRWTGWLGFPVALTLLMPWIGLPVAVAWVLLVSAVLLVQVWRAPRQEGAGAEPQLFGAASEAV